MNVTKKWKKSQKQDAMFFYTYLYVFISRLKHNAKCYYEINMTTITAINEQLLLITLKLVLKQFAI